ncbi:MAG: DinB family protein, partial [Planctomycetia bacterium]|nr:DinB family protein [Planctomycetia bacterium]
MSAKNEQRSSPLVDRYASGGAILAYAVLGLTPEQEQARPGPGAWSVAELAAHLLDSDLVYADRMKRVIAEDDPILLAFDENAWVEKLDYRELPVGDSIDLLSANRRRMSRILRRCADADFVRAGRHSERGRVTLAELLATATHHVDHHLRFLYAKRAKLGVALPPRYGSE